MPNYIKGTRIEILPHDFGDEPKAICANCDSWAEAPKGDVGICLKINGPTLPTDGCVKFFPDPKRWPDADHD